MTNPNGAPHGPEGASGSGPVNQEPQPSHSSPYTTPPVTVRIGGRRTEYQLLQAIVDQHPGLKEKLSRDELFSAPSIELPEVDETVGHTLIHFLYTRQYQILDLVSLPDVARGLAEFKTSVLAYCAARHCGIAELEELTKAKIEELGKTLSVFDVQRVAEDVSSKLPADTHWFSGQMGRWIKAALMADDTLLRDDRLIDVIGRCAAFDKGVVKGIAEMYTELVDKPSETPPKTSGARTGAEEPVTEEQPSRPNPEPTTQPPAEHQASTPKTNGLAVVTNDSDEAVAAAKATTSVPDEYSPMPSDDSPDSPFSPPAMKATLSTESNEKVPETSNLGKLATDLEGEVPKTKPGKKKKKKGKRSDSFAVQPVGTAANGGT